MNFQERYEKHKTAIQKRWEPILKEVLLQEEPGKKISILKKAKQQAAKVIQDPEEQLSFLEHLDDQLKWYEAVLKQNGFTGVSLADQSIETLNTDENTQEAQNTWKPVEKIDWEAGITELAFMFEILFKNSEIGCSMKQYKRRWNLIAKHFTINGKEITSKKIRSAFHELKKNKTTDGKPVKHELYEYLLGLTTEIKGTKT